jgi:hypothetical protein
MTRRTRLLIVVAVTLPCATAKAQQPTTLTLACNGTMSSSGEKNSISMGVIVDFNTRTVQGLGVGYPVKIINADDALIDFYADDGEKPPNALSMTSGTIDRVTGELGAATSIILRDGGDPLRTTYTLKCIPAQRKF